MASETGVLSGTRVSCRSRWAAMAAMAAMAATTVLTAVGVAAGPANAAEATNAAAPIAPCARAVTYSTEIQWGGLSAPWHADTDLTLLISNRTDIVARGGVPIGTQLSWSAPNGNASIVFLGMDSFMGSAQFPGEGPVGYRGTARQTVDNRICPLTARYTTEIQWGGTSAPWHRDTDLAILINNRRAIIAQGTAQSGTQVTWSGPNGNASIMLNGNDFSGGAQFPNEGPVGYRGSLVRY